MAYSTEEDLQFDKTLKAIQNQIKFGKGEFVNEPKSKQQQDEDFSIDQAPFKEDEPLV